MMLASIASTNKKCATATRIANRHCAMLQRVGCKRPHGQITFSMLFKDTTPLRTSLSYEGRRPPVLSCQRFGRSTHNLSAFSTFPSAVGSNAGHLRNHRAGALMPSNCKDRYNRKLSFERIVSSNTQEDRHEKKSALQDISKQLVFIFSDINLRNNAHARSIFRQNENQYLPLKHIMEIQSINTCTCDPAVVHEAIDFINGDASTPIKLHIEETDSGEVVVRRFPPFSHVGSIQNSHRKMMVVDGWPIHKKDRPRWKWAISQLRSMLCNHVDSVVKGCDGSEIPIAYWRYDYLRGVINVEFESEEGAMGAWNNIERATSLIDKAEDIDVWSLPSDGKSRSYILRLGELSLVARSIDPSMIEEEGLLELETMEAEATPESSATETPPIKAETASEKMISDGDQSNTASLMQQKSSTTEAQVDLSKLEQSSSPDNSHDHDKKWEGAETPSLSQFTHAMNQIHQEHMTLPPPSRKWLHEYVRRTKRQKITAEDSEPQQQLLASRQNLCRDVANLVSRLKASIAQGKIRALGGKDGYSLTDSLGRAMLIYSEIPSAFSGGSDDTSESISPYEECLDVFDVLRSLNLDTHPTHFSYAIRAACHESRWEEASNLFLSQIDGDDTGNSDFMATGGFVPIDPALGWDQPLQMGLYAVARDSWSKLKMVEEGGNNIDTSPSKRVFDTAMKMCMISPSGQENYILAAGSALGRAGLWSDCLDFATESDSISLYGPSIAAAAMLACIECSRPAEAINLYNSSFATGAGFQSNQSAASEWQWGGGNITAVKPLCRDLALQAMGNLKNGGLGHDAMRMFGEIIHEDSPLSTGALLGLTHSLEHDGDWQPSIQLLSHFINSVYRNENPRWRLVSDALALNKNDGAGTLNPREENELLANILASVMRACNYEGQHGLAVLMCSIANNSYVSAQNDWVGCSDNETVNAILSQKIVSENQQLLEAYTQSLYGLGCARLVGELLNESQHGKRIHVSRPRVRQKDLPHPESWINAFIAMGRVLEATNEIQLEASDISPETRLLFERGLGRAMEHCLDAMQPAAAVYLFDHSSAILSPKDASLAERVKTFFGMEYSSYNKEDSEAIFEKDNEINLKNLLMSDRLLAAVIKSYIKLGQSEKARSAFEDGTAHLNESALMPQSTNNALEALLDIDFDECISFLDSMDAKCVNPTTFSTIARCYAQNGIWPEIGEVYNRARRAGCISEHLGLISMQAVCKSELLDGKIVVLRKIIDDISSLVGGTSKEWINSRYWQVKRYVGFHYARLLMRWDDTSTCQKEELRFAVNEMRQCAQDGVVAKNDPLLCIVKIAQLYETDGQINQGAFSEKLRRPAVNLILEACAAANKSGLFKSHAFTAEVVHSLRALKANKECIRLVLTLISQVDKCRHRIAMEEAMYAALEERDHESLQLITEVFERSGYDSRRLSI